MGIGITERTGRDRLLLRVIILCVGLIIAHFGVTLFLLADLGSDPFNVFIQGLFKTVSARFPSPVITHGRVHMAVSLLIILILLAVDRSYIRIGTVICMFCGGPIIDVFTKLLTPLALGEVPLAVRILINCLGCVILAYGMTVVIRSEAGTGPNDLVAVVISDKLKKRFSPVRIIVDVCFAGLGYMLGGTLGIGTVICAFLVGTVAGVFMPINERLIAKILSRAPRRP